MLGANIEALRMRLDSGAQFNCVGEFLYVVRRACIKDGRAQLTFPMSTKNDHWHSQRLRSSAQAAQQVESGSASAQIKIKQHHRGMNFQRFYLSVADRQRGMKHNASIRRNHRADAACQRLI